MRAGVEPALLERDEELAALAGALAAVCAGHGRLVVVEAPAGTGKTRLLREARAAAAPQQVTALSARGTELESSFPFSVARQLLEPGLVAAAPDRRAELLAGAASRAAAVLGAGSGAEAGDALADPSFDTLNALYWLVSNQTEAGPLLLVVDDAHWCDSASLRFLRFLAPRLEDLPVLLLVATRPAAHGDDLAALLADPAALVLRPRPLSGAGVAAFVRAALSPDAADEFCAACADASGGNPFLLGELVGALRAQGREGSRRDATEVGRVAPAGVSRAVLARLHALPGPARALAEAVAVLGDDAPPALARSLAGLAEAEAGPAADALAAVGILEPGRRLRFTHPIVRTAVHAELPADRREHAHERAAALLAADGAEPERVAVHLLATPPRGDAVVAQTLLVAGERALGGAAPEAAVAYLRRALEEPPPPAVRSRAMRHLLVAGIRAGDASAFRGMDPLGELTADPATLVASASTLAMWLAGRRRDREIGALLDRAATAAEAAGDADAALRLAVQRVSWTHLPPAEARAHLAPYGERAAPGSDGELVWLALRAWWAAFLPGHAAADAAGLAARALRSDAVFAELSAVPVAAQAILVLTWAEAFDAARGALERYVAEARTRAAAPNLAHAAYLRGELALRRGEVARAAAEAQTAVDIGRGGGFLLAVPAWLGLRVDTLVELGEVDDAEAELAAAGLTASIPGHHWFLPVRFARARLHLARGDHREAADEVQRTVDDLAADGMVSGHDPWGATAASALAALGREDEAHAVLDRAAAAARDWGASVTPVALTRARGVLAGGAEGIRLLEQAAAAPGGGVEHVRALVDLGAALRRANRRADARVPLRAALAEARDGGATVLARRAYEELAATGERARPPGVSGVESLTPSERRITALAAQGQSNREIAQALFLTVKTIETHLTNAYRKLDVHSRSQLAAALAEAPAGAGR